MHLLTWVVTLLATLTVSASPALPERFTATFAVENQGAIIGRTRWSLARDGEEQFRFESVTRANRLLSLFIRSERRESSVWQFHEDSLRPLRYRYRRSGHKARTVQVHFDWDEGVAYNTSKGITWKLPVEKGTLDKLLYLLALMLDVRAGKTELSYTVADGGYLKTYRATVLGREAVSTYLGDLMTVKVGSRPGGGAQETCIWLAPSLHYLPVQVEHKNNGELTRLSLVSTEGLSVGD